MQPEAPGYRKIYLGLLLFSLAAVFTGASFGTPFMRPPTRNADRAARLERNEPVILVAPEGARDPFGSGPIEIREAPQDPFQARTPGTTLVRDGVGGWKEVPTDYQGNLPFPTHGGVMVPDARLGWREVHPPAHSSPPPVPSDTSGAAPYGTLPHSR